MSAVECFVGSVDARALRGAISVQLGDDTAKHTYNGASKRDHFGDPHGLDFSSSVAKEPRTRAVERAMARRRVASRAGGIGSDIVVVNAGVPARRSGGGGIRRRRSGGGGRRRTRRRSSSKGAGGIQSRLQRTAIGGLGYGLLVKHVPQLPRIPGIGRSGTVALAVYFLKPSSQLLQDIGIAAAAIAGASFGESGVVSGDGEEVLTND